MENASHFQALKLIAAESSDKTTQKQSLKIKIKKLPTQFNLVFISIILLTGLFVGLSYEISEIQLEQQSNVTAIAKAHEHY